MQTGKLDADLSSRRPKFNQRKLYDYDDDEEEEAIAQTQLKQD